jgi:hypothetical protein
MATHMRPRSVGHPCLTTMRVSSDTSATRSVALLDACANVAPPNVQKIKIAAKSRRTFLSANTARSVGAGSGRIVPIRERSEDPWRRSLRKIIKTRGSLPDLEVPDDDLLRIEIKRIPLFDRVAARHGEDYARNLFRPVIGGVPDLVRPMQRVEADDWLTHLHVLAIDTKLWEHITPELKEKAGTVRATLSAAICCTTRCLPAVALSLNADSSNTRMLLRMMLTDKSSIARAVGCETPWEYRALLGVFVVDEGTPFVNDDTQALCTDLGIG